MKTTTHSTGVYWKTFAALIVLFAVTWSIGYVDLGSFNLIVALSIAIAKALLVVLFFMHIKGSSRLLHLAAAAGVLWLFIFARAHLCRLHDSTLERSLSRKRPLIW